MSFLKKDKENFLKALPAHKNIIQKRGKISQQLDFISKFEREPVVASNYNNLSSNLKNRYNRRILQQFAISSKTL